MGIDACISVKTRDGLRPSVGIAFEVPIVKYSYDDLDTEWEVETTSRWYSEGYERGFWPNLASILMQLFAAENVEAIYYYGDCNGPDKPLTHERFLELCKHYMTVGNRPYYG